MVFMLTKTPQGGGTLNVTIENMTIEKYNDRTKLLRIVYRAVHPGSPCSVLHLVELPLLLIELLFDLHHAFQLHGLIAGIWPVVLSASIRRMDGRVELGNPRFHGRHLVLLRLDLSPP